jgi:hypothetical protein
MYMWKCHNETPCEAILTNKNVFFSKTENRKAKQVLSGGLVPVGRGGDKERV